MENGYESDYPIHSAQTAPRLYPLLSRVTLNSSTYTSVLKWPSSGPVPLCLREVCVVPAFTTLDDYFNIGAIGERLDCVSWKKLDEGDQSDDEEGANETHSYAT